MSFIAVRVGVFGLSLKDGVFDRESVAVGVFGLVP